MSPPPRRARGLPPDVRLARRRSRARPRPLARAWNDQQRASAGRGRDRGVGWWCWRSRSRPPSPAVARRRASRAPSVLQRRDRERCPRGSPRHDAMTRRRAAAVAALTLAAVALSAGVYFAVTSFPTGLLLPALLIACASATWYGLVRRGI